ncbi:MAG TPA: CvpA family protein [Chloroflexota bacterium]
MVANWVDIAIIAVVAWSVASAVRGGFVAATVSLVAFVLSIVIATMSYGQVADWASDQWNIPAQLAQPIAFTALWTITGVLVGIIGRFVAGPFGFLLHGSPLDLLLSVIPSAVKGAAMAGFALTVVLAPPPMSDGGLAEFYSELRESVQQSQLAGGLVERTSAFDRAARGLLEGRVDQTLNLLTVRSNSTERVDLHFHSDTAQADPAAANRIFELINQERAKAGLPDLTRDTNVDAVALAHSSDMLKRGYVGHQSPDGDSPFDRLLAAGLRFRVSNENLALAPTIDIAHQGLMESPEQRANILSPDFTRVGIGAVRVVGMGRLITEDFIG